MYNVFKLYLIIYLSASSNAVPKDDQDGNKSIIFPISRELVRAAVRIIELRGIIAFPTESGYEVAIDIDPLVTAVEYLHKIINKTSLKPLTICLGKVNEISKFAKTSELPDGLLNEILPGLVTVLLNRTIDLNVALNRGIKQIGIRLIPGTNGKSFACRVASELRGPIGLSSVNETDLNIFERVKKVSKLKLLWPLIKMIFPVEKVKSEVENTVVDLSVKGKYKIVRPGTTVKTIVLLLKKFGLKE